MESFDLEVLEPSGPRFKLALSILRKGKRFSFENVIFYLAPDGYLDLAVRSNWMPESITTQAAIEEVELAQKVVRELVEASLALAAIIGERRWRFILYSEFGWHESKDICVLNGGELTWAEGLPR